jgi:hypothetical protein
MKLLYAGDSAASPPDLKRLLILATEIVFIDRPSVTFDNWGTIGADSPMRRIDLSGSPVAISVEAPPSGPARFGYESFVQADLDNRHFRSTFLSGFRSDKDFASKFVQMKASYGDRTGQEIWEAIVADASLQQVEDLSDASAPGALFGIETEAERRATFRVLLTEASIKVTAAQAVAARSEAIPISENPTFTQLLALRTSDASYLGSQRDRVSAWLATAIIQSVVPDVVVQKADIADILKYREKTADAYSAFLSEIDRLTTVLDNTDPRDALIDIPRFIAAEVTPQVKAARDDLERARDAFFASLMKEVIKWEVPTISIAFLTATPFAAALLAFAAGLRAAAPPIIDYLKDNRAADRKHAFAYLLRVEPDKRFGR